MRSWVQGLRGDRDGTSVIELAVLLPVLFTLGLGMFEFGNLIYRYHLIAVGVRDAARYASGLPQGTQDTKAKNIAVWGLVTATGAKRVPWWNTSNVTVTYRNVANDDGSGNKLYRGGANITMVTVSTSVPYQGLGFLSTLGLGPITLAARHEERLYGVR